MTVFRSDMDYRDCCPQIGASPILWTLSSISLDNDGTRIASNDAVGAAHCSDPPTQSIKIRSRPLIQHISNLHRYGRFDAPTMSLGDNVNVYECDPLSAITSPATLITRHRKNASDQVVVG